MNSYSAKFSFSSFHTFNNGSFFTQREEERMGAVEREGLEEEVKYREIVGYCIALPENLFKSIFRESRNGRGKKWT